MLCTALDQALLDQDGTDVFSKQSEGWIIAMQHARQGIALRVANTDRVNGWAELLHHLGDIEAGIAPTLFIHRQCGRLVETIPTLQHDPNRPEDVLTLDADEEGNGGDDAAQMRCATWRPPRGGRFP